MKSPSLFFLLTFVFLSACNSKKKEPLKAPASSNRNMPVNVVGFVVKPSTISNYVEAPGNLLPFESTELHPEVSGRVVYLNIKEGSYVPKGTLLMKLFDGDLQAQLQKLQVQLSITEKTVSRQGELLKISGISQQEYDLSGLDVSNIKADIDVIKTNISKTEIRAPFNGKLGLRNVSMGAYVTPLSIITSIQQVDKLKLEFTIPEKYSRNVSVGQPLTFTIEGFDRKFNANIMATEATVSEDNRSLKIRAVVTSKDTKLIPGAFAKVILDFGEDNNALMIPSQAIIPGSRNKQVIISKSGIANFAVVETGIRDSAQVQITKGLTIGDTIVLTGILSIKPDSKLNVSTLQSKAIAADSTSAQTVTRNE